MLLKKFGNLKIAYNYLHHALDALDEHSLQAPFIFDLYNNVIKVDKEYYIFNDIENLRKDLLKNHELIGLTNFGATSHTGSSNRKTISSITKTSASPSKTSKLLFRLIKNFKPSSIIELGTSIGINTLYLASVNTSCPVTTFEGCPNLSRIAADNFKKLGQDNIQIINGNIDHTLPEFLQKRDVIDFVYIDANHRYEPTLRYFELLLEKSNENTVMVFDDIYWSDEMKQAWKEICAHPKVNMSIDLFSSGIVILKKFHHKQHYVLSF